MRRRIAAEAQERIKAASVGWPHSGMAGFGFASGRFRPVHKFGAARPSGRQQTTCSALVNCHTPLENWRKVLTNRAALACEGSYRGFFPDSVRIFASVEGLSQMGPWRFVHGNSSMMSGLTPSKAGDTKNRGYSYVAN
jgi:hypothetical protein